MTYRTKRYAILGVLLTLMIAAAAAGERAAYEKRQAGGDCLESMRFVVRKSAVLHRNRRTISSCPPMPMPEM